MSSRSRDAFAIVHFGSNPVYLELELYFLKMLRQYTRNDILYLYSVNDTPPSFVEAIRPLVAEVVPYDDRGITYDVSFKSIYTNFNILRTCNFIFAYNLDKYDKVCIIESDMVIMKNLDSIFNLKTPAVLTYYVGDRNLSFNDRITNNPQIVLSKCQDMGRLNGGIILIYPSKRMFDVYKAKIRDVIERNCKYPNETLFEYVNNSYYNLPVQYNLSHYHAKPQRLHNYQLDPRDIFVFHFNETAYKHIDIIKNPVDEKGDNWLDIIGRDKKYAVKKLPIFHYKTNVYDRYRGIIEPIVLASKRALLEPAVVDAPIVEAPVVDAPIVLKPVLEDPLDKLLTKIMSKPVVKPDVKPVVKPAVKPDVKPVVKPDVKPVVKPDVKPDVKPAVKPIIEEPKLKSNPIIEEPKPQPKPIIEEPKPPIVEAPMKTSPPKTKKCPKGTRRNKKTGLCEPSKKPVQEVEQKITPPLTPSPSPLTTPSPSPLTTHSPSPLTTPSPIISSSKKCPKGTRRNKKTGLCESVKKIEAPKSVPEPLKKIEAPKSVPEPLKKCPKGTRRNKKTGLCEPTK